MPVAARRIYANLKDDLKHKWNVFRSRRRLNSLSIDRDVTESELEMLCNRLNWLLNEMQDERERLNALNDRK